MNSISSLYHRNVINTESIRAMDINHVNMRTACGKGFVSGLGGEGTVGGRGEMVCKVAARVLQGGWLEVWGWEWEYEHSVDNNYLLDYAPTCLIINFRHLWCTIRLVHNLHLNYTAHPLQIQLNIPLLNVQSFAHHKR